MRSMATYSSVQKISIMLMEWTYNEMIIQYSDIIILFTHTRNQQSALLGFEEDLDYLEWIIFLNNFPRFI